jgi:hypothetical protein
MLGMLIGEVGRGERHKLAAHFNSPILSASTRLKLEYKGLEAFLFGRVPMLIAKDASLFLKGIILLTRNCGRFRSSNFSRHLNEPTKTVSTTTDEKWHWM